MGLRLDSPLWRLPHSLYRLFAVDGTLLYIGITADLPARLRQHAGDKDWWHEVARHTATPCADRRAALAAESMSINRERPLYNTQYGPRPQRRFAPAAA